MRYDLVIKRIRRGDICGSPVLDALISDGRIVGYTKPCEHEADEVIDGDGLTMLPGFIDLHVHLRDPGLTYKEDIISGSKCAAAGGVTSVFAMPNTKPVCDTPETIGYVMNRAKDADCRVFPVGAISKGLGTREVCDLAALKNAGAAAFSDDGKPVADSETLMKAMRVAAENDLLIMSHCEDLSLAGGAMNEGIVSEKLGLKGIPRVCEDIGTMRDIAVAEYTGCRLHICHVSTRGSVEAIRRAKARGVRVTAETCPHYFALSEDDIEKYGAMAKMNPPLRTKDDVKAVIDGILDGTLDCISTDHAPHSDEEKSRGLADSLNGIIGLQTSFMVSYTTLVQGGYIDLPKLTELMSKNPAEITGLDKMGLGSIEVGSTADFTLVSTDAKYRLEREDLRGKSHNTPFIGMTFGAQVMYTFVSGRKVFAH